MERLSLEYIAGLIDADGSISISEKHWTQGKYSYKYWNFIINFRQLETSRNLIEDIQYTLEAGKIYNHKGGGTQKMLTWQTTKNAETSKVCEIMIPYLRIKKFQAGEMIRAINIWSDYKAGKLSKDVTNEQIEVIAKSLNNNNQTETFRRNQEVRRILVDPLAPFFEQEGIAAVNFAQGLVAE